MMRVFGFGVRKMVEKMLKCGYGFYKKVSNREWGDRCPGLLEAERGSGKNSAHWIGEF